MSVTTLLSPMGQPSEPVKNRVSGGLLDPKMLLTSLPDAARKLDPRTLYRNPVMFIVEIGSVSVRQSRGGRRGRPGQGPGRGTAE